MNGCQVLKHRRNLLCNNRDRLVQDCNNGGTCVAPDVCKCARWDNAFRDGREAGGRPLFLKPNGDPQQTGWTGYDCSVPICVQVGMTTFRVDVGHMHCVEYGRVYIHAEIEILSLSEEINSCDGHASQFEEE